MQGIARPIKLLLFALIAINILSYIGFATFVQHPQWLKLWPYAIEIFSVSYALFAQAHIMIGLLALVWMLILKTGHSWLWAFAWCCTMGGISEVIGVRYGFPFGDYSYTNLLGPKLLDTVPYLILVGWFTMAISGYGVANSLRNSSWYRIGVGAFLLTLWDLTLDPAMSRLSPFWVWHEQGGYYGTPWINFFGWYVTSLVILIGLEVSSAYKWIEKVDRKFLLVFYAINIALPAGIVLTAGYWGAIGATIAALLAVIGLSENKFKRLSFA